MASNTQSATIEPETLAQPSNILPLYSPLKPETKELRVLHIHPSSSPSAQVQCSLQLLSLTDTLRPDYQALSYAWGDPKITRSIRINDHELRVTKNLEAALRHIRGTDSTEAVYLWADAVCINQNDLPERGHQVQMMGDIYRNAKEVIAWLGEASAKDNSDLGMEKCEEWGREHQDQESRHILRDFLGETFNERIWRAVGKIFERPYWSRRWTFQEVLLAQDIVVMCGHKTTAWKNFKGLNMAWYQVTRKLSLAPKDRVPIVESAKLTTMQTYSVYKFSENQCALYLELLRTTMGLNCSDPRDHLYSLRSLALDQEYFPPPDYEQPISEVYTSFASIYIKIMRSLVILSEAASRLTGSRRLEQLDLPSWVPDWRSKPLTKITLSKLPYEAAGNFDIYEGAGESDPFPLGSRTIRPSGIYCDRVSRVAPSYIENTNLPTVLHFLVNACGGKGHPTGLPLLMVLLFTLNLDLGEIGGSLFRLSQEKVKYGDGSDILSHQPTFLFILGTQNGFFHGKDPDLKSDYQFLPEGSEEAKKFPQYSTLKAFIDYMSPRKEEIAINQFALNRDLGRQKWMTHGRRIFVTEEGYFGFAGPGVKKGDHVAVLFGCKTPLILRPVGEEYCLVDECFIYGFMTGEAVSFASDAREDGKFKRQTFPIH